MKYLTVLLLLSMLFVACNGQQSNTQEQTETITEEEEGLNFGEKITEEGAISASEIVQLIASTSSIETKFAGKINSVCQKKGCWMRIAQNDSSDIFVTFKDYGFFVPKDAAGKTAIMRGVAYRDTVSVETLKHYAEDAGKSEEEIAAITEPEFQLAFEADGVIIQ